MAEPTLAQVFGSGASQTGTDLVIKKADLADSGLTPSATNTAEALLLALILHFKANVTSEMRDSNTDQSVAVTDGYSPSITTRNDTIYLRNTISIEVDKILTGADTINPNDY